MLQNFDAYLAGFALTICAQDAKDDTLRTLADRIALATQRWSGNRGPRGAIVSAIIVTDFQFDDRGVQLAQPTQYRDWMRPHPPDHAPSGGYGAIAKITAKGTALHLEFVQIEGQEEACAVGQPSHRIEAIRDDGSIQYHYDCSKWTMVRTQKGSPPADIDASFAGGIKAGMKVSIVRGVVDAAWATAKSDTPIIVFGAPVK